MPRQDSVLRCWREGARRVHGAPAILAGVWFLTLLLALPLGLVLRGMIRDSLGSSLAADTAAAGVNHDWWNEFQQQAGGIGGTLVPSIIGFAAPLRNISSIADNLPLAATVASLVAVWLALWSFVSGGILDRYARARTTHTPGFFAACGVFFFRFLRLGALAGLVYWLLFRYVHHWLFDALWTRWTRDLTVERDAFLLRVALYALFALLLAAFNLLMDYARIRAVVEDRRSMTGALVAAARFVARHPGRTTALYLLNALLFLLILAVYAGIAPGARWEGVGVWGTFLISQVYILARVWAKLLFAASQVAFFQSRLAHAGYASFPGAPRLDPPVVEAIGAPLNRPPTLP